ncbi:ATP-binding protein [Lentzea nigeriaca]|uniref:ATP-binding protein n=1 Tax=Lentzea nigeriaca TaxID=1128665 RepID=UPI001958BC2C|nr:AAA family ATPase [Lentzea nigeriaca]MBM7856653.1 DNA-binding CsgD family transcriptional regulator [Lentzea nigeriaca]
MILLERADELRRLTRALHRVRAGHGDRIVITGPLGCGKSALLDAVRTRAAGVRVLTARCSALEQDFAFGVARQLLDPALAKAGDRTRTRWFAGPAGLALPVFSDDAPADPAFAVEEAAVSGLTALTWAMAADEPVVLLIDDLHWADDPSLRWIARLWRTLDRQPVLLVATTRDGERCPSPRTEIRPAPLSPPAIAELVGHRTGQTPDAGFVAACHAVTGGNPLFLRAVLNHVTNPTADQVAHVRELRPARLKERLVRGLATLPEHAQNLAKAIATLGDDDELAGQLAGLTRHQTREARRILDQAGIMTGRPAVRDAIEESMPVSEREAWQARAVQLLHDNGKPAEQVAARLLAVTTVQGGWVIDTLGRAAATAMRRGAPEVAARYLRRALRDVPAFSEHRARLLVDLATAERFFDPAASLRHISYAVPLFRSVEDRARALVRLAPTALGQAPRSVRELVDQVAADLRGDDELAYRLEARQRYVWHANPALLADSVDRLQQIDGVTPGARELRIVLLDAAMLSARLPAHEVASVATAVLRREPPHPRHVHTAIPLLIRVLATADAAHEAASWLGSAFSQATDTADQALIRAQQAFVLMHLGKPGEAHQAVEHALDLAVLDWRGDTTTTAIGLTAVAMELRDPRLIAKILSSRPDRDDSAGCEAVYRMLHATGETLAGQHVQALGRFLDCGRVFDSVGWRNPVLLPWCITSARLHARLGDLTAARDAAAQAWDRAVEWGAPVGIGRALYVLGRYTPGRKGLDLLHEAVEVLHANPFEQAKALLQLGARERADGDPQAQRHLEEARRLAVQSGAGRLARRIAKELDGNSPGILVALTRTEFKVAGLVVRGLTNAEIAEELGVTSRAIEKHLTNSFRKLGIRRRTELPAALARAYPPSP